MVIRQKKWFGGIIGVFLLCLVIASTGATAQKKSIAGTKLTIIAGVGPVDYWRDVITPQFEKETGVKVKHVGLGWDATHDKLAVTFAAADSSVDVAYTWAAWTAEFARYLTPLTERLTPEMRFELTSGALSAVSYNGVVYGLPRVIAVQHMFYNTEMFKQAGLDPKTSPVTWYEFVKALQKLTIRENSKVKRYGFAGELGAPEVIYQTFLKYFNGADGKFYDKGGNPAFNSSAGRLVLQNLRDLVAKYNVLDPASFEFTTFADISLHFREGRCAIAHSWPGLWFEANNPEISKVVGKVKVAPIPGMRLRSGSIDGSEGWAISKFSKHKETAWAYIKFQIRKDIHKKFVIESGWLPVWRELLYDPEVIKANSVVKAFQIQSKYPSMRYGSPYYTEATDAFHLPIIQAIRGEKGIEAALQEATEVVAEVIEKYKK